MISLLFYIHFILIIGVFTFGQFNKKYKIINEKTDIIISCLLLFLIILSLSIMSVKYGF